MVIYLFVQMVIYLFVQMVIYLFVQMVTKTKKIFVGGLSATSTVEDVKGYFEQIGKVNISFYTIYIICFFCIENYRTIFILKSDPRYFPKGDFQIDKFDQVATFQKMLFSKQ